VKENVGTGVWRPIALLLAGSVVGAGGSSLTGVTEKQVRGVVREVYSTMQSPWVADKPAYEERMRVMRRDLDEVRTTWRQIIRDQDKMNGKLDVILEHLQGGGGN